ncbi:hypothetical protein M406DRAFT_282310 [Cryphonectria parasitica EP155]|uniref:ZZ-type domain-containing protein n=1 Tax=Cryphonectria parasitica (strain ATCC 38755 / EP155) TaxID=660469 RepID=A0A9P5CKB0_CRYP1|nr:uncharacterized protein M406DRAFT_282310 [Cryphonectria parasitica EP155]KAF3760565.1 hypothetical protein M406DRAFT_282310 [Cryphonectria parasitica EP155]
MASTSPATPDTVVTLKVHFQGSTRRFKLPLRDLGVNVFEDKIRAILCISPEANATIERYSDSASSYVVLDPSKQSVWKQLFRAAKAKQKLKLRVTLRDSDEEDNRPKPVTVEDEPEQENQESAQTEAEDFAIPVPVSVATSWTPRTQPPKAQPPVITSVWTVPATPPLSKDTPEHNMAGQDDTMQNEVQTALSHLSLEQSEAAVQQETTKEESETTTPVCVAPKAANFAVCCNNCDRTIPDDHFHCSTCDDGDFDLCPDCVDKGVTCYNAEHWLLKRFVRGDVIVVSVTERVHPKPKAKPAPEAVKPSDESVEVSAGQAKPAPAPATPPRAISVIQYRASVRTCNSCVQELPDKEFLHCTACEDFDLCKTCFAADKHGHHPQHGFEPAVEGTPLSAEISKRLAPGRDQRHHAICDGCDKFITGVRHKCLDCPDWDFCGACVVNAGFIHPEHRFVPIYSQIAEARSTSAPRPCHYGICCDGPLCVDKRKTYIVGERYKCTVCHDTDFCAGCEASPANMHNRTHPLIKFKTPVRRVEVTTKGEDERGQKLPVMGDRLCRRPVSPKVTEAPSATKSVTSSVRTVVSVKPEPEVERPAQAATQQGPEVTATSLIAFFERDTVPDGTVFPPNHVFEQTWVLRNGGMTPWPVGCSIRFVGGDYMGRIDPSHPAGVSDLISASETTVTSAPVAPGEEFAFKVMLRTPSREGKSISYWRLTTKDGYKFGHRLWCHVTVEATKAAADAEANEEIPELVKEEDFTATENKTQASAETSQMIFPKLEKESPEASTHEDVKSETAEAVEESDGFEDCGEDDEWAEDSDGGFMTDEEYDILDASDEEFSDELQKKVQKK